MANKKSNDWWRKKITSNGWRDSRQGRTLKTFSNYPFLNPLLILLKAKSTRNKKKSQEKEKAHHTFCRALLMLCRVSSQDLVTNLFIAWNKCKKKGYKGVLSKRGVTYKSYTKYKWSLINIPACALWSIWSFKVGEVN